MDRRRFLRALGLGAGALALAPGFPALAAFGDETYGRFAAARATRPWLAGWETVSDDLPRRALMLEGRLPKGLRGTLFRNGPGRFDRNGFRYRHWFDGDGLLQAWRLGDDAVTHEARFVHTHKYAQESAAGRFLYNGAGTRVPDAIAARNADDVNAANTSVMMLGDKLYALWEGGSAWTVDPATLASEGPKTFRDDLAALPFSAHPLVEPDGSVWNIGQLAYAGDGMLLIWRLAADGSLISATPIPIGHTGYAHSFAMSARHLTVVLAPMMLEGGVGEAFFESLQWRPERGSLALVIDKDDPSRIRRIELPAGLAYHWADAHEAHGMIELHGCWYDNGAAVDEGMVATMAGARMDAARTDATSSDLVRVLLPLAGGASRFERSGVRDVEFPDFDRRDGSPRRHLYALAQRGRSAAGYLNAVLAIDRKRDRSQTFNYGEHVLAEEHRFVPRPGAIRENDGWLIGTALDARRGQHLLSVFDAAEVEAGPLCQARLPRPMPLSFHATFTRA